MIDSVAVVVEVMLYALFAECWTTVYESRSGYSVAVGSI